MRLRLSKFNLIKRLISGRASSLIDAFTTNMSTELEVTMDKDSQHTSRGVGKSKKAKKPSNKIRPIKMEKFRNDTRFDETSYYFKNGLRYVEPYSYTFQCHIKGRWYGKKVLDVCKKEFRSEAKDFYEKAISVGLLTINGRLVSHDRILHSNELLRSRVHRHEPPVSGEPIKIVHSDDDVVVVNKPASIPVHPCGKYRHNTLVFILGKEYGFTGLHTIHRLDRLTSGLLIFARTTEMSKKLDAYVRNRDLEKTYLCKVKGQFPSDPVVCEEPILIVSHKIGVCRVNPQGKTCRTEFKRLSYDGETSIVQCLPHTGRMHQIRVHLQYMGYPITNDPLYNNPVWGSKIGKGVSSNDISDDTLIQKLIEQHDEDLLGKLLEDHRQSDQEDRQSHSESHATNVEKQLKRTDSEFDNKEVDDRDKVSVTSAKKFKYDETVEGMDHNEEIKGIMETGGINPEMVSVMESAEESSVLCTAKKIECDETGMDHDESRNEEVKRIKQIEINSECARDNAEESPTLSIKDTSGEIIEIKQIKDITTEINPERASSTDNASTVEGSGCSSEDVVNPDKLLPPDVVVTRDGETEEERLNRLVMSFCQDCKIKYRDPKESEMRIYLHALRYKGPDFDYSTEIPRWAQEHLDRCEEKSD